MKALFCLVKNKTPHNMRGGGGKEKINFREDRIRLPMRRLLF